MTPGELAGRLSGCLTEAPGEGERAALADALRAVDAARVGGAPVFGELAAAIERDLLAWLDAALARRAERGGGPAQRAAS